MYGLSDLCLQYSCLRIQYLILLLPTVSIFGAQIKYIKNTRIDLSFGDRIEHAFSRQFLQTFKIFLGDYINKEIEYLRIVNTGRHITFLHHNCCTCRVLRLESKVKAQAR